MKAFSKVVSIVLVVSFLSLSFPLQVFAKESPKNLVAKAQAKRQDRPRVVQLQRVFFDALQRSKVLLEKVERGDLQATVKVAEKVAGFKGIRNALLSQFSLIEKNLDQYAKKGILSPEKKKKFEETKKGFFEKVDALLAKLSQIDPSKPPSANASVAAEAEAEVQILAAEQQKAVASLPDPSKLRLPHRTGFDLVEEKDPPGAGEILKLEQSTLAEPESDTAQLKDPPLRPGPPTSADLQSTPDVQITPEIQAKATELGGDAAKMLAFVHDQYVFEPYFGSQKGSLKALFALRGNDMDQASLLISLLRASGIPARYEIGTVVVGAEKVLNWLGVADPFVALNILRYNGVPAIGMKKDGTIGRYIFTHTWVTAFLHGDWIRMDPSFKQYQDIQGIDYIAASGFDLEALKAEITQGATIAEDYFAGLNENRGDVYLEARKNQFLDTISTNFPTTPVGTLLGGRKIVPLDLATLQRDIQRPHPRLLPYRVRKVSWITPSLVDSYRFLMRLQGPGLDVTLQLPVVALNRISLNFVPATPEDASIIQAAGGIFNVSPAFIVNMRPVIQIEQQVVATGTPAPLGSQIILTSTFSSPDFFPDSNDRVVTVGANLVIGLDYQQQELSSRLRERINALQASLSDPPTEEQINEVLHITASAYAFFDDLDAEAAARKANVVWTRLPEQLFTSREVASFFLNGLPVVVKPGGYNVDVKRNIVLPFHSTNDQEKVRGWLFGSTGIGSALESFINEYIHGVDSVSTTDILGIANASGLKNFVIGPWNAARATALLSLPAPVKDFIFQLANAGRIVTVPESLVTVNEWTGTGFVVLDPNTGSSGFFITGGISGSSQFVNGGATSTGNPPAKTSTAMSTNMQNAMAESKQAQDNPDHQVKETPPDDAKEGLKKEVQGKKTAFTQLVGFNVTLVFISSLLGPPWTGLTLVGAAIVTVGVGLVAYNDVKQEEIIMHRIYGDP